MGDNGVYLFDKVKLTKVFSGVETPNFSSILSAIESRVSSYEDEDPDNVEGA
jgi:hypothetical protein